MLQHTWLHGLGKAGLATFETEFMSGPSYSALDRNNFKIFMHKHDETMRSSVIFSSVLQAEGSPFHASPSL